MNGQGQPAPDPHFQSVPYELATRVTAAILPFFPRLD
jgi:hypothetical protein